ncbi:MAG: signal peptidase I [Verrucomicrobiota bacterium]
MEQTKWREKLSRFWREWAKPMLIILLITGVFRSAIADWNDVPTGSMKPTILEGDRIFVNKLAYDLKIPFTTVHLTAWAHPKRGNIIVFFSPIDGIRLVKRVVGLPGDQIELRDNQLLVNGKQATYGPLDEHVLSQIRAEERPSYRFAAEEIEQRSHPVMSTPQLSALRSFTALKVPADSYFVMGDNRDNSKDSRYIGCIPRGMIVGQAKAVVLSVDPGNHYFPRWARFFSALP